MDIQQLMELRESIRTSVRQLEDLKGERALSTNQQKALDKYLEQVEDLDRRIAEARTEADARQEKRVQAMRALGATDMATAMGSVAPGQAARAQLGSELRGVTDASELRSFGIGDDLRSIVRPAAGPNFGAVVRGMALGDWSHVPAEQRSLISSGAAAVIPGASVLAIQEQAMQQSVVFQAGARGVNIDRPSEKVARVVSTGTPEWKPDAVDRVLTDQTITIQPEDLTAFSAWLFTECSVESLEDAYGLEEALTAAFAQQLGLLYDQAAFAGSGVDMPKGVGAMTAEIDGINEITLVGDLVDHKPFISAAGKVLGRHHVPSSVTIEPDVWTDLAMLTDTTGQPIQPPKAYADLGEYVSDFLPAGNAIVGDWSKWLFGTRTSITLEVSRTGDGFKRGFVQIRAYVRFGGIPVDPSAFCRLSGITLAEEASA